MKAINQTPQKQQHRSTESVSRRLKETPLKRSESRQFDKKSSQIVVGKSLNADFFAVSEDLQSETKLNFESSVESDLTSESWLSESFLSSPDPVLTSSTATSVLSSLSPPLNLIGDKHEEEIIISSNRSRDFDDLSTKNIDAQIFLDYLRDARFHESDVSGIDLRAKIFDALIKVFEEFSASPEAPNRFSVGDSLVSEKVCVKLFCLLLWIVIVIALLMFSSFNTGRSFPVRPPPT